MRLYFVRHAQSQNNALYASGGDYASRHHDPGLSETGKRQLKFLQSAITDLDNQLSQRDQSSKKVTHLFTSLMIRAIETAVPIGKALNLQPIGWLDLHEIGGVYQYSPKIEERKGLPGNKPQFLLSKYPDLILPEEIGQHGWWRRPFETPKESKERAKRVLDELISTHVNTDNHILLVSHRGFYNLLMNELLSLSGCQLPSVEDSSKQPSSSPSLRFQLNNAAISCLDITEESVKILYLNWCSFLPAALVT